MELVDAGAKPSRHRPREAAPLVATRKGLVVTAAISSISTVTFLAIGMVMFDIRMGGGSDLALAHRLQAIAPGIAAAGPAELSMYGALDLRQLASIVQVLEPQVPVDDGSWLAKPDWKKSVPLIDPDRRQAFVNIINDIASRPPQQRLPALDWLLISAEFMRNNENLNVLRTVMGWKQSSRKWMAQQNAEHFGDTVESLISLTDGQAGLVLDEKALSAAKLRLNEKTRQLAVQTDAVSNETERLANSIRYNEQLWSLFASCFNNINASLKRKR